MSRLKTTGLLLLLVAAVCFFSLPALTAENPWDADDDGSGKGSDATDSSIVRDSLNLRGMKLSADDKTDPFSDFLFTASYKITTWFYSDYFANSPEQQVKVDKAKTAIRKFTK